MIRESGAYSVFEQISCRQFAVGLVRLGKSFMCVDSVKHRTLVLGELLELRKAFAGSLVIL